jgi:hypothetical protein
MSRCRTSRARAVSEMPRWGDLKPEHLCDKSTLWRRRNPARARQLRAAAYKRRVKRDPHWYARQLIATREKNIALKREVFEAYGGAFCACCGEDHLVFLGIDHVNGCGNSERRDVSKGQGGVAFYRWLKRNEFPEGYQVLCHNCNFAKHFGGCPHGRS